VSARRGLEDGKTGGDRRAEDGKKESRRVGETERRGVGETENAQRMSLRGIAKRWLSNPKQSLVALGFYYNPNQ